MNKFLAIICTGIACVSVLSSCKEKSEKNVRPLDPPKYTAQIDQSVPPVRLDVEKAIHSPAASLKLSQIASEIKYYTVGDATNPVSQAISIPDSNAFITFNNPRIYYRKQGRPSKRYGFKALAYKWDGEMYGHCLFYDKKTTRMYCALSGKDQNVKEDYLPCIGELPPLDSMLTITRYLFPEMLENRYTVGRDNEQMVGFSSTGYTSSYREEGNGIPDGFRTYSLEGELLCQFKLKEDKRLSASQAKNIPSFHTFFWNEAQDRMTFMIPFCDTVYQLRDKQTVAPLYDIHFGEYGILSELPMENGVPSGKAWLRTLLENQKGVFMGIYQKDGKQIGNWLGWTDDFKPILSYQAVYLKDKKQTYVLDNSRGFVNDLDGGLPFWPDGQTDDYLYMIRTITEMRETVKRTGAANQKELIEFLDNPRTQENQFVMIVVR